MVWPQTYLSGTILLVLLILRWPLKPSKGGQGWQAGWRHHAGVGLRLFLPCPACSQITIVKKIKPPIIWSKGVHPCLCLLYLAFSLPALTQTTPGLGVKLHTWSECVPAWQNTKNPGFELKPTSELWPSWTRAPVRPLPWEKVTRAGSRES